MVTYHPKDGQPQPKDGHPPEGSVVQTTLDNFQEIWEVGNKKQNVLNPLVNCLSTPRTIINPSLCS